MAYSTFQEARNMVPRSVQVVDHAVENLNKSSSNQRFIPYKVLIGKGITLNASDSTVHEDHARKINSRAFNLPAIQFLTCQKQECIKPMYKIYVVWLSSSLRINSCTLLRTGQVHERRGKAAQKYVCTGQTFHHDERTTYDFQMIPDNGKRQNRRKLFTRHLFKRQ